MMKIDKDDYETEEEQTEKRIKLGLNGQKVIQGSADTTKYHIERKFLYGEWHDVRIYDNPACKLICERDQVLYIKSRF